MQTKALLLLSSMAAAAAKDHCDMCGYNCDDACNCGSCNAAPGCQSSDQCLGTCNSGGNAMWCGVDPTPAPTPSPPQVDWSTANNTLYKDGEPVVFRGFGITDTEYLLRSIGMTSWWLKDWTRPKDDLITVPDPQLMAATNAYLAEAAAVEGVQPAIRIPMTASYWLDVCDADDGCDWADANVTYPGLSKQYRGLIEGLVANWTQSGVAVILDLHLNDDSVSNQQMALKDVNEAGKATANALDFWDSVSWTFRHNQLVVYELYNEPHIADYDVWANGDDTYAGYLEMVDVVRAHAPGSLVVIAGQKQYAYDADSLIQLDADHPELKNVVFNAHPYMGAPQSGSAEKSAEGFDALVARLQSETDRPVVITEFGQGDCGAGECYQYPGTWPTADGEAMSYTEAIATICNDRGVGWLPWAWKPSMTGNSGTCKPLAINGLNGSNLVLNTGYGSDEQDVCADWAKVWATFGPVAASF